MLEDRADTQRRVKAAILATLARHKVSVQGVDVAVLDDVARAALEASRPEPGWGDIVVIGNRV